MRKKYQRVLLEIVELDNADVIRTSGESGVSETDNFGSLKTEWFTTGGTQGN